MCMFMHVPGGSLGWAELAHDIALLLALLISFIRCLFVKNANLHAYIAFCMILCCVVFVKVILVLLLITIVYSFPLDKFLRFKSLLLFTIVLFAFFINTFCGYFSFVLLLLSIHCL